MSNSSAGENGDNKVIRLHNLSLQKIGLMKDLENCEDFDKKVKLGYQLSLIEEKIEHLITNNFHNH